MTTIGTRLFTLFHGRSVGRDSAGNRYYRSRGDTRWEGRERRWVVYKGPVDASRVPPEWHAWLHHDDRPPLAGAASLSMAAAASAERDRYGGRLSASGP